uniref:Secreted protein 6 n=1 Tax=Ancylostoma caninum TaxID=29170 RepID=Q86GK4_ANCCA|nr:secreted protein 6 precursor [Ancylostoma caninum]
MKLFILVLVAILGIAHATDFQCWNFKSTDTLREHYLKSINNLRKKIADGSAENKSGKCPQGKNIYKLSWDCELELKAQQAVDQCKPNVPEPAGYSQILKKVKSTCDPTKVLKKQIEAWWTKSVKDAGVDNPPNNKQGLEDFAKLANGKATKIGCAQKNCNEQLYVACVINEPAPAVGMPIYEVGAGCNSKDDCTTYLQSKCSNKVCVAGHPGDATTTTSTPATTAPTTPTIPAGPTTAPAPPPTTAAPTTTSTIGSIDNTICPQNQVITDSVRLTFLNTHNGLRSQLAQGQIFMGNGARARPASKMRRMVYNCDAESSARNSAAQCLSSPGSPSGYTENLHVINNNFVDHNSAATQAFNAWWSEINTGYMRQAETERNMYSLSVGIPNFAKMAWETNAHLGCAIVRCGLNTNVVCPYSPKSDGGQIYKMGPFCRRCPDYPGTFCNQGLCSF